MISEKFQVKNKISKSKTVKLMKGKINLRNYLSVLLACGVMASCDNKSTTTTGETEKKDSQAAANTNLGNTPAAGTPDTGPKSDDTQFLVKAAESDMVEIKASEDAKSKSSNKDVKELARMMVTEHTKMSKVTGDLAATKNVTLPPEIPADAKSMLDKAATLKGSEFDKEYISHLKSGHEEAVAMLEKASTEAADADIKSWASAALPKVKHHLEMVKDVEAKLK